MDFASQQALVDRWKQKRPLDSAGQQQVRKPLASPWILQATAGPRILGSSVSHGKLQQAPGKLQQAHNKPLVYKRW